MKKALITGIAGFAGSHLTEHLLTKKIQITGFIHPKHSTDNIGFLKDRIKLVKCDILDKHSIFNKINNTDYDYVFHLAAFSSPTQSFQNPKITLENNIIGQLNL